MSGHTFDGAACRRLRNERGTRIEALAVAIGRSWRAVLRYETGAAQPPIGVAADIAAELGVDLIQLVSPC